MTHDEIVEMRIAELLADRPEKFCDLAIRIRRSIVKSATDCSELLYCTHALTNVFTYSHRMKEAFIHIACYSEHINLGFNQGTLLPDPTGMLEGTGKLIRHIRVDSISTLRKPATKKLIDTAIKRGLEAAESFELRQPKQFIDKT